MSNGHQGHKRMYMGERNAGKTYVDLLGNVPGEVTVESNGHGEFKTMGGSVSIWVPT